MTRFVEPSPEPATPNELFARYVEYYRESAIGRVSALSPEEQRATRVPSGWTPIELLNHLAHMEQRWFVWGFLGEQVDSPWGDRHDDRWHVGPETDVDEVARVLRAVGARTSLRRCCGSASTSCRSTHAMSATSTSSLSLPAGRRGSSGRNHPLHRRCM